MMYQKVLSFQVECSIIWTLCSEISSSNFNGVADYKWRLVARGNVRWDRVRLQTLAVIRADRFPHYCFFLTALLAHGMMQTDRPCTQALYWRWELSASVLSSLPFSGEILQDCEANYRLGKASGERAFLIRGLKEPWKLGFVVCRWLDFSCVVFWLSSSLPSTAKLFSGQIT